MCPTTGVHFYASVSPTDKAFRIGGDEFVIVVGPGEGEAFIDRIKKDLVEEQILFSYGIEASTPETLKENLIKTDKAMYEVKIHLHSRWLWLAPYKGAHCYLSNPRSICRSSSSFPTRS
jgi:GGDEF domain-containing protein